LNENSRRESKLNLFAEYLMNRAVKEEWIFERVYNALSAVTNDVLKIDTAYHLGILAEKSSRDILPRCF